MFGWLDGWMVGWMFGLLNLMLRVLLVGLFLSKIKMFNIILLQLKLLIRVEW